MQAQNVEEYKAIRDELARVRSCITSYVSFVVLGSGPAFAFLAGKTSDKPSDVAMGFAAILLAILSTLVLFLLSYKFTSHNRYAGYSKLLTHERFSSKDLENEDIFFWEICIDKLRATDSNKTRWKAFLSYCAKNRKCIPQIPNLRLLVKRFSGPHPTKDKCAWIRGWWLLLSWSRENSGSWKLPLYIARIFGTLVIAYVVFAIIFLLRSVRHRNFGSEHYALLSLFPVLLALWMVFVTKLFRQVRGSEKVEAFCRKFTPFRVMLLRELDKTVKYSLMGASISQKDDAVTAKKEKDDAVSAKKAGKKRGKGAAAGK